MSVSIYFSKRYRYLFFNLNSSDLLLIFAITTGLALQKTP